MPNQINKSIPKNYNAGDMLDAYSFAESDMQWMSVAITDIKARLTEINKQLDADKVSVLGMHQFKHILDMYEYIVEERQHFHSAEAEQYRAEWEANKKAVAL